ncbi:helix-turn-helix domain-containing protein [Chryseobacterium shigense]|uniref:Helix-turn-helix domain-containing protein n=1 Tax=Chryseobacterium shigense TaxID=297244 RepID=A0A841N6W2_9FLAO|nr:helix-turn-helix domain-containing protein [Chryseobacterium shigense]MBB6372287.1 hypothetical protein [Chryseobacterium shigense]
MEKLQPDYKRIYNDIIIKRCPENKEKCLSILRKKDLSFLDVIKLNSLIFGSQNRENNVLNQRHRSYDQSAIIEILNYQKKNNLNNIETARYFKLSRNTVAKWRKLSQNMLITNNYKP